MPWKSRSPRDRPPPLLTFLQTLEEGLEMAGLVVFVYALTGYMAEAMDGLTLTFALGARRTRKGG